MVRTHLLEAAVVVPLLAHEHHAHRRLHVVVDAAPAGHDNPRRHGPPLATLAIIGISTAVYLLVQHFESSSSARLTPFLGKGSVGPV